MSVSVSASASVSMSVLLLLLRDCGCHQHRWSWTLNKQSEISHLSCAFVKSVSSESQQAVHSTESGAEEINLDPASL